MPAKKAIGRRARRSFHAGRSNRRRIGPAQWRSVYGYSQNGWLSTSGRSRNMILKYCHRLSKGLPHVTQSVTPTQRKEPAAKPPAMAAARADGRGGAGERRSSGAASSGSRRMPSLQRTAKAAPASRPAASGRARPGGGEVARRKAPRRSEVETGRGKGLAP